MISRLQWYIRGFNISRSGNMSTNDPELHGRSIENTLLKVREIAYDVSISRKRVHIIVYNI